MDGTKGHSSLVIGVDYGTDSVRAVVVEAASGKILGQSVFNYPRWAKGLYCDPAANVFRQHPLDYLEGLESSVKAALAQAGAPGARVVGIAVDTTGSTPVFADALGRPLGLSPEFAEDPDALFILWKDHSSIAEAEEINSLAASMSARGALGGQEPLKYVGGIYSSEWFWAKTLHVVRRNPKLAQAAATVVEHCDWIPALLCGIGKAADVRRGRCAAGHKGLWHESFDGYPKDEFFAALDPRLVSIKASLGSQTYCSDTLAGRLCPEWASRLGLSQDCVVAVGAFDAHLGALGGGIRPGALLKVMGTSTCDMLIAKKQGAERLVAGICGQVDGSIVPGYLGYEAGQSAFGDVYAWFRRLLSWPLEALLGDQAKAAATVDRILPELERAAAALPDDAQGPLALDWFNGRRSPDADQSLKGAVAGLNLGSDAPRVFRALLESTAFGSRAIVERFAREGVAIDSLIGTGGVSRKSPLAMQTLADVTGLSLSISAAEQGCALGSAMFAATAAGLYPDVLAAQAAMGAGFDREYKPRADRKGYYDGLYERYAKLGRFAEGDAAAVNDK